MRALTRAAPAPLDMFIMGLGRMSCCPGRPRVQIPLVARENNADRGGPAVDGCSAGSADPDKRLMRPGRNKRWNVWWMPRGRCGATTWRFINVISGPSRGVQSAAHGPVLMKTYGARHDRFYGARVDSVTSGRRFPASTSIIFFMPYTRGATLSLLLRRCGRRGVRVKREKGEEEKEQEKWGRSRKNRSSRSRSSRRGEG